MSGYIRYTVLFLCLLQAANADDDPKLTDAAKAHVEALRSKIEKEVTSLGPEHWAGRYYEGDGTGVNVVLDIAPAAGFAFEWHGCFGLYDRNFGRIQEKDGEIHLKFELENERKGFHGISPSFLPVKWGERRYLIAPDEIIEFCNCVNSGYEPRMRAHGLFLLNVDDVKKKVEELPALPENYQPYLLKRPINAEVSSIGTVTHRPGYLDSTQSDTVLVLNVGKKHGVMPQMEFHVYDPGFVIDSATVVDVTEETCKAVISQPDDELAVNPALVPKTGWKLSTRMKDFDEANTSDDPAQDTNRINKK